MLGKFENELAEYLYGQSIDGGCDEEIGSVSEMGWFGKFDLAILSEDEQGFVEVLFFDNHEDFEREWKAIETSYAEFWTHLDPSTGGHV